MFAPRPWLWLLPVLVVAASTGCERTAAQRPAVPAQVDPAAPVAPPEAFDAQVVRVVDGDTLVATTRGSGRVRVRIIGIDSPETATSPAGAQCHGAEASAYADGALTGKAIRAAYEGPAHRDRFGRELWHVWLPDGTFYAGLSVEQGHARALQVRPHVRHAAYINARQDEASRARRGLWGRCPQ